MRGKVITWSNPTTEKLDGWFEKDSMLFKNNQESFTSVGIVVKEDKDTVVLASHFNNEKFGDIFRIPTVLITSQTEFELNTLFKPMEEKKEAMIFPNISAQLKWERYNLMEIGEDYHGINVQEFIKEYNKPSSYKQLQEHFVISRPLAYSLISILKRLGIVKSHAPINKPVKKTITEIANPTNIDLKEFINLYTKGATAKMLQKHFNLSAKEFINVLHKLRYHKLINANTINNRRLIRLQETSIYNKQFNNAKAKNPLTLSSLKKSYKTMSYKQMAKHFDTKEHNIANIISRLSAKGYLQLRRTKIKN